METQFACLRHYSDLRSGRKARLYLRLCNAKGVYEIRCVFQSAPAPTAASRELKEIRKSISRLATFASRALDKNPDKAARAAFHGLETVAERWASQQDLTALPSGFDPRRFESKNDEGQLCSDIYYGSGEFLRRFFESARFVERFTREAEKALAISKKENLSESAIEWLCGICLPELFTYTFKLPFTRTIETETSRTSDGILFVLAALEFLQIKSSQGQAFSPATIRTHAQKVDRLKRS